jgi:hypothetical protein
VSSRNSCRALSRSSLVVAAAGTMVRGYQRRLGIDCETPERAAGGRSRFVFVTASAKLAAWA